MKNQSSALVGECHSTCNSGTEIDGIKFYGTPWIPIISYSWAFEAERDVLSKRFSAIPHPLRQISLSVLLKREYLHPRLRALLLLHRSALATLGLPTSQRVVGARKGRLRKPSSFYQSHTNIIPHIAHRRNSGTH